MKQFLLASFVGALLAFGWSYLSWKILPWHQMATFTNSAEVAQVIANNAEEHNIYTLPAQVGSKPDASAISKGPFVYAIVRPSPLPKQWSMITHLISSFGIQLIGSIIISIMVLRIRAKRYISRASIGCSMGLFAGLMMTLPTWNWFELPVSHTVANALDPLIAWTISGLVIAMIIKPKKPRKIFLRK